ncbi:MAG: hypothetical protein P8M25_01550, partial [Paracoccaceae bacterium]|nr:hypothetical protein [Paracoccaceae bacterium]
RVSRRNLDALRTHQIREPSFSISKESTGGDITEARVALGAVAPTVLLVEEASATLVGSTLDETDLVALAFAASAACNPINDKRGTVEFRTEVAGVLSRRAAKIAYDRARG